MRGNSERQNQVERRKWCICQSRMEYHNIRHRDGGCLEWPFSCSGLVGSEDEYDDKDDLVGAMRCTDLADA